MKKGLFLLGMLLSWQFVAAQVQLDYCSGYVVLENNDTLYGQLRKQPYNVYVAGVNFKGKDSLVDRWYTAYDLRCFHYDPDVTIETIEIKQITKTDTTYRWMFALRRLTGPVDFLIMYLRSGEGRFFVKNEKLGLTELKNPIETIQNQVFRNNTYLTILAKYTNDLPEFQDRIRSSSYDERSLVNLITEYNAHFGTIADMKPRLLPSDNFLVSAGWFNNVFEKEVKGFHVGFEYAKTTANSLMKSELVLGVNYKRIQADRGSFSDKKFEIRYLSKPTKTREYLNPQEQYIRINQTANVVGVPIFFRFNERLRLVSPIFELGMEPYVFQEHFQTVYHETYRTNISFGLSPILGLGLGLNYQRFRLKYMFFINQLVGQGITLQYQLR